MSSGMGMGQTPSGTPDHLYDLVSVLYHSLESSTIYQKYVEDAQKVGDSDLMQFFQDVQREDRQRADRAKNLLTQKSH